jgi:hypothetical protein
MDMSSMDFTSLLDLSKTCTGIVDGISADVDAYVVLIPIKGTAYSGIMAICTFCSFSFIIFSISASIYLIFALCYMIRFNIYSLWPSVSTTYLACEYSVVGSFNYFLIDCISTLFFFRNSSVALTFVESYPIFNTISSNDLILLSLAKEETFSNFNWDRILFKDM